MKFTATIHIMPRPEILDPQGKATLHGLHNLGFSQMEQVRIGKRIELSLDAEDEQAAKANIEEACRKLLANPIVEQFRYEFKESE